MVDPTSENVPERPVSGERAPLDGPGAGPNAASHISATDISATDIPATDIPASDIPSGETPPARAAPAAAPTTRTGTAFKSLIAGAIVLVLLLVFILENTESVKISFFGFTGHVPLGVALLLAAIGGALLVGIVGAARIMQLRHHVRHRTRPRS